MDRGMAVKVVAAVVGIAGLSGAGAYALGGAGAQQLPSKVVITENGSQGSLSYRTTSDSVADFSEKTVRAKCPKGTHATGGGYYIGAFNTPFTLYASRPYDGADADYQPDDGWEVVLYNGHSDDIGVTVRVVCSK